MPGTSGGTGQPIWFMCAKERANKWRYDRDQLYRAHSGHERIVRTGRTRYEGRGGSRMLPVVHEYRCSCGHVGWSKHKGVMFWPMEGVDNATTDV